MGFSETIPPKFEQPFEHKLRRHEQRFGKAPNKESLSLVSKKFPTNHLRIVALILLPYNISVILKLKGHAKRRSISRISNF